MKFMTKGKRKAFTLVELLVVIAILAILATVSVIGYTSFVDRANESNALTEMTQARDLIKAELMDGEEHTYDMGTTDTADDVTLQMTMTSPAKIIIVKGELTGNEIKQAITDLADLPGTFVINATEGAITSIVYTPNAEDAATATWDIASDTVTTAAN